ncbi:MMPL family transporter (plasmid) [Nicoliella spurrieriana]|uniref:MMPL family transporter n=1 Tax=Nicoliella spurrieriana TaxID=2925830 RepID=A0A976X4N0_9LACO|nr:MMPL family transporter [Nicoliella spurrieriana]UQS86113.1 MMPL family transporter [Nicoliella spurrieriana]
MSNMLNRWGQWSYQNKFKSLLAWLVVLVIFIAGVGKLGSNFNQNFTIKGLPSTEIQSTLKKEFKQNVNAGTMKVVIQSDQSNGVNQKDIKTKIQRALKNIRNQSGIKSVADPYTNQTISKDKSTTYISITFKKDARLVSQSQIKNVEKQFNSIKHHPQTKIAYDGSVQITPTELGGTSEIIGIVIAFILLLILFRSFVTAGLPIITAIVGLISGVLIVTIGSNFVTIVSVAQTLATMLSLAVGIDYALFIVNRYRGELRNHSPQQALGNALATAGSSVLFAGVTVVVALLGLSVIGMDFLTQMGVASAIAVVFAILSAVTLLPAVISLASKFIKADQNDPEQSADHPGWFTKSITKYPIITTLVSLVILIAVAIPAKNMRLGMPYNGSLPKDNTQRQAYDMISDKFGEGINAPLIGVVELNQNQSKAAQEKTLKQITNRVKEMRGTKMIVPVANQKAIAEMKTPAYQNKVKAQVTSQVQAQVKAAIQKDPTLATNTQKQQLLTKQYAAQAQKQAQAQAQQRAISPIPAQISSNHKYAMFVLIPKKGTEAVQTEQLTKKINDYAKTIKKNYGTNIILTGTNAVNIDTTNKLNGATPVFAGIVILLAFILLMFMFRSFLIPLVAMVGFGLSLLASFGVTTLTIQEGMFKEFLGISKGAPVLSFLPVIFIGILFGLAMDYEVFMVSRIREEYLKTGDNSHSVAVGIKSSGPVIITAALIMIAVFGSFALSTNPTIKSLGLSLAFGIFFDAFLVRLILVPSMIKILGKANWFFPGRKQK